MCTYLSFCVLGQFAWSFYVHAMATSIKELSQLYEVIHLHVININEFNYTTQNFQIGGCWMQKKKKIK